jgi:hypothetical protein
VGRVSQNLLAMSRRVPPQVARVRGDIGKELLEGAKEGTQHQLYDVSKGPLTGRMKRSIAVRYLGAHDIAVGWDTKIAKYAPIREKKKGRSKRYGHIMDMDVPGYIISTRGQRIRELGKGSLERIVKG